MLDVLPSVSDFITDFHCLLSFLFKKGSKDLWCLSGDYQAYKIPLEQQLELRTLSRPPLHPYTELAVLWYVWALVGNTYKISTGSTEGNEEVLSLW